jgi:hypothetical protein
MIRTKTLLLIPLLLLFSCRTVQPSKQPVAGMYPTVDISRRLEDMKAFSCTEEQLREALKSIRVWDCLLAAGMKSEELSLVRRSLAERGYAEIDVRRAKGIPIHWITFASIDGKKMEISAAFLQMPPPSYRQEIMLEKTPCRQETRTIRRNRKLEYQYLNRWQCPTQDGNPLEIWKISGQHRKRADNTYWELRRIFEF